MVGEFARWGRRLAVGIVSVWLVTTTAGLAAQQGRPAKGDSPKERDQPKESHREPKEPPHRNSGGGGNSGSRSNDDRGNQNSSPPKRNTDSGNRNDARGTPQFNPGPPNMPVRRDGEGAGGGRVGNPVSEDIMRRRQLEAEQMAAERQREREAREQERTIQEQKFLEEQQRLQQKLEEVNREIARLRSLDEARARQLALDRDNWERELRRREREQERARQRWRDQDNRAAAAVAIPAPRRRRPVAAAKPAKAPPPAAKPAPKPLTAAELERALADLASGDEKREISALKLLAAAAPDDAQRARVAKQIVPLLGKDKVERHRLAAKALTVWATKEHVPDLMTLVGDDDKATRQAVIHALGELQDARAIDVLAARLTVEDDRSEAAKALAKLGLGAEPLALRHLADEDKWVRLAAIDILAKVGGKNARTPLAAAAEGDDEFQVRSRAKGAIEDIDTRIVPQPD